MHNDSLAHAVGLLEGQMKTEMQRADTTATAVTALQARVSAVEHELALAHKRLGELEAILSKVIQDRLAGKRISGFDPRVQT
jgi:hypothetical protein